MTTKTTETGNTLGQAEAPELSNPVKEAMAELEARHEHAIGMQLNASMAECTALRAQLRVAEMQGEVFRRQLIESAEVNSEMTDRIEELEASNITLQDNIEKQVEDLENDLNVAQRANRPLREQVRDLTNRCEHYKQNRRAMLDAVLQYLYEESERNRARGYADGAMALAEAKEVLKARFGSILVPDQKMPGNAPE